MFTYTDRADSRLPKGIQSVIFRFPSDQSFHVCQNIALGDEVLTINELRASDIPDNVLEDILGGYSSSTIQLRVSHEGRERAVTLVTKGLTAIFNGVWRVGKDDREEVAQASH